MNVPRWLSPATNPALYTALASIGLSVWQAIQVDFWAGSLTVAEVGRVAAPIVIAALVAWQRRTTTPLLSYAALKSLKGGLAIDVAALNEPAERAENRTWAAGGVVKPAPPAQPPAGSEP